MHRTPSYLPEEFAVTPVADNTQITVTLPSNLVGVVQMDRNTYNSGNTFSFTLNIGESVQIQTRGSGLGGTRVTATSPIALFSGNVRTMIDDASRSLPSRDHLVEQLLPYNRWGSTYFAPSTPNRDYRDLYIFLSKLSQSVSEARTRMSFMLGDKCLAKIGLFFQVEVLTTGGSSSTIVLQAGVQYNLPLQCGNGISYRFRSLTGTPFQVSKNHHI